MNGSGTSTTERFYESSATSRPNTPAMWGLILAILATALSWVNTFAIPASARAAAAIGDYGNIYTFMAVSTGVVVTLNIIGLGFGIAGAKRSTGRLMAGAAIALSTAGLLGVIVNLFVSFVVLPLR